MAEKTLPSVTYLMVTGIALAVFGGIAMAAPALAGTAVVFVIGALLVVSGVFQFVQGLREPAWASKLLEMILGAIAVVAGIAVLAHPLLGLKTLAIVLAVFFVIEGVWKILASFSFRPAPGWIAMLISGILGLVLAYLIFSNWPLSGIWAVGILVGVDLVVTGASMIALALTIKRARQQLSGAGGA